MKWFKFYGQDFLTDPKIKILTPAHRLMWITLLCLASNTDDGLIKYITEEKLTVLTDIELTDGRGALEIFENMEMITIIDDVNILINKYKDRQETNLTASERASKSRKKKQEIEVNGVNKPNVNNVNARLDKNRLDKNIKEIYKEKYPLSYLIEFPLEDFQDIEATEKQLRLEGEKALNWLKANNKKKSDHKAFLRNWVLKVYKKRSGTQPNEADNYEIDDKGMARLKSLTGGFKPKGMN